MAASGRFPVTGYNADGSPVIDPKSGYVEDGFVGATRELSEYQQYNGEFADPLEIDESCYETFRLYSPLTAGYMRKDSNRGSYTAVT